MIRIEVREQTVNIRNVPTKKGTTATFREQPAYAYVTDQDGKAKPYPSEIVLNLKDNQEPFAPGHYALAPASVWVNRFNRLDLAPKLVPVK